MARMMPRQNRWALPLFLLLLLAGGALYFISQPEINAGNVLGLNVASPTPDTEDSENGLSATFRGTLPCPDCEGVDTQLTLSINANDAITNGGSYTMTQTYLGKDTAPLETTGTWIVSQGTLMNPEAIVYTLTDDNQGTTMYFLRVDQDTLRLLDSNKNDIETPQNTSLIRQS